ncbi:DNA-binding transcriptional MerR regulator [Brevibacterium sanguinis]|uniref:DNA-binding transcriptional MerR regulator n=2 Tax=Brevibacterium TaxID=1696 RepID=A0A366IJ68_9MICO|nr:MULTISPECIES: MerR family transcriptional regulator [Brevibacterium]RBP65097.1 DNA-binding transcriptional MerR regulator [Brevibacterium sanguinis]RBP71360.1 DNA-binding transcriptional MerR regulator [Brevibacterium celere]
MKIGDFARLGQVSVRMLRHYESLGLLLPEEVDHFTGRRSYSVEQLARLNRIMALNALGIPLRKMETMLDSDLDSAQLSEMLHLRRHQLRAEQSDIALKLAELDFRLALLERTTMSQLDCIIKELPAERILGLTVTLGEPPFDTSEIGPLFSRVAKQIAEAGGTPGIGVALYTDTGAGTEVTCGYRTSESANSVAGRRTSDRPAITELPAVTAATLVHEGPMNRVGTAWQHLSAWCISQGHTLVGPCREIYLQDADGADEQSDWVVELQQPVLPA